MFFTINIYSKNLNSIKNFLEFIENKMSLKKLKIKFFKRFYENASKKKKLTILKSPHVNKTAQEQFEHKTYKKKLICFTEQPFLFLMIFKILRFKYFSDVYILINFKSDLVQSTKLLKKSFNFKNNYSTKKIIINYLNIVELKGEFLINKTN